LLLASGFLAVARPARADLAIFTDGRVVKVADYRVDGDDIELFVPGGGSFTTSLLTVERIVDDEVPPPAELKTLPTRDTAIVYDLSYKAGRSPAVTSNFDALIDAQCRKSDFDPSLVSAVIRAESNFDPYARSRKGARGLMQLMPATARRLKVRRLYDPASNIRGGVEYLKELARRYGNRLELALAAYNAGEEAVDQYGGVPPYRETVDYVKRVLRFWTGSSPEVSG
jgi:hypothetical protein